jgi:hypothetical protein
MRSGLPRRILIFEPHINKSSRQSVEENSWTSEIWSNMRIEKNIQNVLGGKVNILGDRSIGHCTKRVYMSMCPIPDGFRDRGIWIYSCKILVRKRYYILILIFIFQVTNLLVYNKFSKIPPSTSMHFETRVRTWRACCSSEFILTFLYAGNSIHYAIEQFVSHIHYSSVHFSLYPNQ